MTLYVHGQNAITKRDLRNKIAQLRSGFKPLMNVRTLFGTSGSAWGIIEIDTDGSVYINHIYGVDSITWQWVTVSVTFVY